MNSNFSRILTAIVFIVCIGYQPLIAQEKDQHKKTVPSINVSIRQSMQKGADYLLSQMNDQGVIMISYQGKSFPNAGITGLALYALTKIDNPSEKIQTILKKGAAYLASLQKESGGIYLDPKAAPPTYITSVALMALNAIDKEKYADIIHKGQGYLVDTQSKDKKDTNNYGGIGYGSDGTANLSSTQFAIEALRTTGYTNEDVYKRALVFLNRCQNDSETNATPHTGNDGGFRYNIHSSKAGTDEKNNYKSYGTMTYAGVKSYIYAGLTADDTRVKNALSWLKKHYTVDANPGLKEGLMGLFYYFNVMAKTMNVLKITTFEDGSGIHHNWKNDLAKKIISLQKKDGSWKNTQSRWFENVEPLVTAYSIQALSYCLSE